ncbi:type IX secretion system membrane protein PorP/SprF [Sinomicrobium kalidii]|uniref:PorP/SprF family type IX secretion system membrane protein n=1 Tax=Sinomicrobium kalidii TaxID=2900738 RepID=UPI001E5D02D1|nr:type IX secretion system membrane protein PorP/SprF [Sinomicrobium kalidii]UGU16984.1 type IX secretion system membrane protein PorP/SprF [Sinomicrobium kalidii]
MKIITVKKSNYILFICMLAMITVKAQQDPQYTQYMYNMMSFNPAYAGSVGTLEGVLLHRSQWTGIDGAPQTQSLSVHSPLNNEKVGLGFNAAHDKLGPSKEVFLDGNFSYTIQTGYFSKLAFGVKAGVSILDVDWSEGDFKDPNDPVFAQNVNKTHFIAGAGAFYYTDKWYVGFSVPSFLRYDYYEDREDGGVLSDRLHYFITGGYVFELSPSLLFKPATMLKIVRGAPVSVDLSANFLLQERFTLGASYRWDDSVSALAGFQISPSFFIGYSYDYTTTSFNRYNDGTHEIILRYQMPFKSSRIKSPRFF